MKDIFNSVFHTSTERMKNPFVSSYVIAAVVLNWQIILIIMFSDLRIENRIELVKQDYIDWRNYFLFPFLIAIFYVLILPYFMMIIDILVKHANENQIIQHYNKEAIRVRKKSEVAQLTVQLERIRADSDNLAFLRGQIENLTKTNKEKDSIIADLKNNLEELKIIDDKEITNVMKKHSLKWDNGITEDEFQDIINDPFKNKVLKVIGDGIENGVPGIRYDFFEENKNIIKYFNSIKVVEFGSTREDYVNTQLTKKGKVYYKRMNDLKKNIKSSVFKN